MPLFELESSVRGRRRVFVRAQLPLLLGTVFITGVVAVAVPAELVTPILLAGILTIVAASAAAVLLPWERWSPNGLISVAVADLVGVALIRAELFSVLPSVGMLAIFPILWLAYGFRRWVVVIAIAGALFITSFAFAYRGVWPTTALEWANVITLPALIVGVAVVVNIAATQLRRNSQRLRVASDAQAAALQESRDNELLSRAILDTVAAGVAFYNADNQLVLANKLAAGMVELVGFRLDQPPYAGDNVLAADRSTPIPYEEQIIPRALRGEEITDHVEWLGPADQQTAIMASSRRVHRDDGVLLGTVIVAYDITELAHSIDIREQFLTTVSHELRTPLTSITGYLELLEDSLDPTDTTSSSYLTVVSRNASNLHDRIGELLTATDIAAPLQLRPAHISTILNDAAAKLTDTAEQRNQTVHVTHDNTDGITALVDAARLRRAFEEIIDNALKFSPPDTTITITHTHTARGDNITVQDQGPGISRGEQTRVFDRFYRTPYARNNAIQGFGLGLTLAKNTITAHHGHITITATNPGTTITATIPDSPPQDVPATS